MFSYNEGNTQLAISSIPRSSTSGVLRIKGRTLAFVEGVDILLISYTPQVGETKRILWWRVIESDPNYGMLRVTKHKPQPVNTFPSDPITYDARFFVGPRLDLDILIDLQQGQRSTRKVLKDVDVEVQLLTDVNY